MTDENTTGSAEATGASRPQPTTVQQYRHAARRSLKEAQRALSLRNDATRDAYVLVNGMIESVIQGQTGFTQEQQVERLTQAHDSLVENIAALPEAVAAARAAVEAQMDEWEADIVAKAQEAVSTLAEAKTFAAERDFDAWQEQKRRKFGYGTAEAAAPEADGDDLDGDEDDDSDE